MLPPPKRTHTSTTLPYNKNSKCRKQFGIAVIAKIIAEVSWLKLIQLYWRRKINADSFSLKVENLTEEQKNGEEKLLLPIFIKISFEHSNPPNKSMVSNLETLTRPVSHFIQCSTICLYRWSDES